MVIALKVKIKKKCLFLEKNAGFIPGDFMELVFQSLSYFHTAA